MESTILGYDEYPLWRFVGIYGCPIPSYKDTTWQPVDVLSSKSNLPMFIARH